MTMVSEQWKKDWQAAKSKPHERMDLLQIRAKHREINWDLSNSSKINLCLNKAASVLRREMEGAKEPALSRLKPLGRTPKPLGIARCKETPLVTFRHPFRIT